jgi:ABC-type nickel/cobalt efflux system permease component RcnA
VTDHSVERDESFPVAVPPWHANGCFERWSVEALASISVRDIRRAHVHLSPPRSPSSPAMRSILATLLAVVAACRACDGHDHDHDHDKARLVRRSAESNVIASPKVPLEWGDVRICPLCLSVLYLTKMIVDQLLTHNGQSWLVTRTSEALPTGTELFVRTNLCY